MRLAVVTDIHHGPSLAATRGEAAECLFAAFAASLEDTAPAAVVDLGDRITDADPESDRTRTEEMAAWFQALRRPVWHICGNHDLVHLSIEDNARRLGVALAHATADLGGWRLLFWRPHLRYRAGRSFAVEPADLDWLERAIATADRPALVFSHAPLLEPDLRGNPYFENDPAAATFEDRPRISHLLAGRRHPVVCVAGHVHADGLRLVDGVAQLTLQSLTETWPTPPEPVGAHGLLELGPRVRWSVAGRVPFGCELRLEGSSVRA